MVCLACIDHYLRCELFVKNLTRHHLCYHWIGKACPLIGLAVPS